MTCLKVSFRYLFAVSAACAVFVSWVFAADLKLTVFDVGQAESVLINTPDGRTALVDGGSETSVLDSGETVVSSGVLPLLKSRGIKFLDVVVISHPHPDHVSGLFAVFSEIKVGKVCVNGYAGEDKEFAECLRIIREKKIPVQTVRAGSVIDMGPSITVNVFGPPSKFYFDDGNNNSTIIKLTYRKTSVLLTGDAETEELDWAAETYGSRLKSDVMKLPHHGSYSSVNGNFIEKVNPAEAVVSCGKDNPFGHPHAQTLSFLKRKGIRLFRTDLSGDISIALNGTNCSISGLK